MSQRITQPKIILVPIERLLPSTVQPRLNFDDIKISELAKSISTHGILQPLIVRKAGPEKMEIIAGERRYRASLLAKIKELPCIVMNLITEHALAVALIENIQREDLNPIEEALAYHRLKETSKLSQEELAIRVGKDRATVANIMRLLRLPKVVQNMVVEESLSMGHARALLALDSHDMMTMVAKKIAREGLSVRRVEGLIRSIKSGYLDSQANKQMLSQTQINNPLTKELRQKLERVLGTRVELRKELNGYSVVIHFRDEEQLNGLLDTLGVEI